MNLIRMHRSDNVNCLSQAKASNDNRTTFTRTVYQVDARKICQLVKQNETKSFGQLLYLASIDRQYCSETNCNHLENNILVLTNLPNLIPVAIHWNPAQCTTSDVEDFISIIDRFIYLRELFYDVTISEARIKQLNLIGLICFYGGTIEVFFSYEHTTSKWLFCFDGNVIVVTDWNAVIRKCIDFHLQPFLLIYANSQQNSVDISQLLKRTVIQTTSNNTLPCERRLEHPTYSMTKQEQFQLNKNQPKHELHSFENLTNISSFGTLNSSMLFMPKSMTTSQTSYINQETVVKVMQQQLLKKESLSDTASISSSLTSSPLVHIRHRYSQKQKSDDTLSNADSSTSSQRDSGLSSGINDGSSDDSSRSSLAENEQTEIDSLIKQTELKMSNDHLNMSLASIEHYIEQSLKYESASNYSSALESCQRALLLVDQILNLSHNGISVYARTKRNSLLLRIRSLRKREMEQEQSNNYFLSKGKFVEKKNENISQMITSILSSTTRLSRPKKNVKFSDNVALIVPTSDDINEPPSEHLIHSFLRKIHQQQSTSDSDSDTQSSSNDIPIGLSECSLCHKRCSKNNQIGTYCSNCHFYMQRFQPTTS